MLSKQVRALPKPAPFILRRQHIWRLASAANCEVSCVNTVPTVFVQNGYRVSFYSYDLTERIHVHVFKDGHECKVWLNDFSIAFNHGFRSTEIAEIRRMITDRRSEIVARWLEHGRGAS